MQDPIDEVAVQRGSDCDRDNGSLRMGLITSLLQMTKTHFAAGVIDLSALNLLSSSCVSVVITILHFSVRIPAKIPSSNIKDLKNDKNALYLRAEGDMDRARGLIAEKR